MLMSGLQQELRVSGHGAMRSLLLVCALLMLPLTASVPPSPPHEAFEGAWALDKEQSSPVDPWNNLSLQIEVDDSLITLKHHWSAGRFSETDSMTIETGGVVNRVPIGRWLDNRHLGVSVRENAMRRVTAHWIDDGRTLQVVSRFPVYTSQGRTAVRILSEYRLAPGRESLALLQLRSTRPKPVHYAFRRAEGESA